MISRRGQVFKGQIFSVQQREERNLYLMFLPNRPLQRNMFVQEVQNRAKVVAEAFDERMGGAGRRYCRKIESAGLERG